MAESTEKAYGEPIGGTDNNDEPIKVGDYMKIKHGCDCNRCQHYDIVRIVWNEEWKAYGMKTYDDRWIGKASSANGFLVHGFI